MSELHVLHRSEFIDQNDESKAVVVYQKDEYIYRAESSTVHSSDFSEATMDKFNCSLIPDEHIFPPVDKRVSVVVGMDSTKEFYVQRPHVSRYSACRPNRVPSLFLQEIWIVEAIKRNPHKHLIKYYGCHVYGGRIRSMLVEKCVDSLYERTWIKDRKVDKDAVIEQLFDAVAHLHRLGYCHNNINPSCILFRADGSIALSGFQSCLPINARFVRKSGAPPFRDFSATHSRPENDFYSIEKVELYIETGELNGVCKDYVTDGYSL